MESNQEVTLKKTDKHAADCSKAVRLGVMWSMWDVLNCLSNNVAKSIRLLDKKHFFLFMQEKFHASKSFWKIYPL